MEKSPMPTDVQVGRMVRMRRLMLEMSQTDLADALGISFQQVQKYEKGTNRISASRLQHIANFLQVPVAFFFDSSFELAKRKSHAIIVPDETSGFVATNDGLRLIKAYMQIKDRKVREAIVQLVEELPSAPPSSTRIGGMAAIKARNIGKRSG